MAALLRHSIRRARGARRVCTPSAACAATAAVLGLSSGVSAQQQRPSAPAARAAPRVVCEEHHVGEGAVVESGETVHVHYEGRLNSFDGPIFDSSYASGEPLIFKVDESPVIQGWHDGVKGMRVGGRRKVTVPAELGYGSKGIKDPARNRWVIPPNSTLCFRYVPYQLLLAGLTCRD
jgi:peptidylprolyl isomerase